MSPIRPMPTWLGGTFPVRWVQTTTLTITSLRLPDVTTLLTHTSLCSSLSELSCVKLVATRPQSGRGCHISHNPTDLRLYWFLTLRHHSWLPEEMAECIERLAPIWGERQVIHVVWHPPVKVSIIHPAQWTHLQFRLFSSLTSGLQLVHQRLSCGLSYLWESGYKRSLATSQKE